MMTIIHVKGFIITCLGEYNMQFLTTLKEKYSSMNIIAKASIWFITVATLDKAVAVLTQPFINRILSVDEIGIYGVYNSWYSILSIIASLNLFGGVLEVYITNNKNDENQLVASFCSLSLICVVFLSIIILSFNNFFSSLSHLKSDYLFLMMLTIFAETCISFWSVPKRFNYSYKIYSIVLAIVFILKSALSVSFAYIFKNDRLFGRLLGLALPPAIVGIFLVVRIFRNANLRNIFSYWKRALKFNLPLIPHYLSTVLLASSDKIMIEQLTNTANTGLYTVAYSFSSLCLMIFSAINSAYNPYSMKAIKNKNYDDLKKSTKGLLFFSIIFSILIIYLAPEGLFILGGEKYLSSLNLIPVLVVGIFFSSFYFVFSNIEFVYEKTKLIFPITLLGAIINICLNYLLIPIWGYEIAAYTTLIGYVIIACLHYFVSLHIIKKDVFDIKCILLFLAIFVAFAFLGNFLYTCNSLIRYAVILLLLFLLIFFGLKKLKKNKNG